MEGPPQISPEESLSQRDCGIRIAAQLICRKMPNNCSQRNLTARPRPAGRSPRLAALLVAGLILAIPSWASPVMIDLNHDGMSDIWELIYGFNLDPNGDPDGDGFSNVQESTAATDPFDPASFPAVGAITVSGTNLVITVPSALGKQYTLLSRGSVGGLSGTNWVAESAIVARSGTNVTFVSPAAGVAKR